MTAGPRTAERISIFLVDDHDVVREGLMSILDREPDLEVVGEAADAERAIERLPGADPDVVVLDYRLAGMDGIDLCREIAERRLRARVVILSAFLEEDVVQAAFMAGARAYVVKDVESGELKRAIRAAARDEVTVDPKVAGRVASSIANMDRSSTASGLGASEMQVLRLLCQGKSNERIAAAIGISVHTVKLYLGSIYTKLGVRNRSGAVGVALRRGLA